MPVTFKSDRSIRVDRAYLIDLGEAAERSDVIGVKSGTELEPLALGPQEGTRGWCRVGWGRRVVRSPRSSVADGPHHSAIDLNPLGELPL